MNGEKFCKDCRFCKVAWFEKFLSGYRYAKCTHPSAVKEDELVERLVTGNDSPNLYFYCATQRLWGCDKEGKNFQPK
jgi:hypothetical protein